MSGHWSNNNSIQALPPEEPPSPAQDYPPYGDPSQLPIGSGDGWAGAAQSVVQYTGVTGLSLLLIAVTIWAIIKAYESVKTKQIVVEDGTLASVNVALMEMLRGQDTGQRDRIDTLEEKAQLDKNTITYLQQENDRLREIIVGYEDG